MAGSNRATSGTSRMKATSSGLGWYLPSPGITPTKGRTRYWEMVGTSSSMPSTRTPRRSMPSSSSVSRSAVCSGVRSSASRPPPGKLYWLAWVRRVAGRRVKTTCGTPSRSNSGTSTEASRSTSPGRSTLRAGRADSRASTPWNNASTLTTPASKLVGDLLLDLLLARLARHVQVLHAGQRLEHARLQQPEEQQTERHAVHHEHQRRARAQVVQQPCNRRHARGERHQGADPERHGAGPLGGLQQVLQLEDARQRRGGDGQQERVARGVLALEPQRQAAGERGA